MQVASQTELVATENTDMPNTTEIPKESSSKSVLKSKPSKTSVKSESGSLESESAIPSKVCE